MEQGAYEQDSGARLPGDSLGFPTCWVGHLEKAFKSNLFVSQSLRLKYEENSSAYFRGLLEGFVDKIYDKHLIQCLVHSTLSISVSSC